VTDVYLVPNDEALAIVGPFKTRDEASHWAARAGYLDEAGATIRTTGLESPENAALYLQEDE
jgi:hypothetical protein